MRLLALAVLVSLVSVGIYYRVLQVAIFAVAAALHGRSARVWQN